MTTAVKTYWQRTFLLLAILLLAASSQAQDPVQRKLVRVGWYESPFNHKDSNGMRRGYAYEYQRRIAANTNWKYEYVEGTWVELFEMLKRGEIDLLSDVTYTKEREKQMFFSEFEMGTEDYYILIKADNKEIKSGDLQSLDGKKVGVFKGTVQEAILRRWIEELGLNTTVVDINTDEIHFLDMLGEGQIDAIATTSNMDERSREMCIPMTTIGTAGIYFAINKNRPDLKEDLDDALWLIRNSNFYYNRDMHEKYFSNTITYKHLTPEDTEYLKEHKTIRIGYRDNYLPYCTYDEETKSVKGLLHDFITKMSKQFKDEGLIFETIAYPSINEAIEATRRNEVDMAFPCGMDTYDMEQLGLIATEPMLTSAELAVVKTSDIFHNDSTINAAINGNNPNYLSLIRNRYPEWNIVNFPSTKDALKGVARGDADLLMISNYRLGVLDYDIEELKLKAVATGAEIPMGFAVNEWDSELFSLICRLIRMVSKSEIQAWVTNYSTTDNITMMQFFRNNFGKALIICIIVIGMILLLYLRSRKEHIRAEQANQAKTQFLFNMSHDIRTPMNAIIGYTKMMEKNLNNEEKSKDYLAKISASSNFLLELINNVLEMARIDSGKTELNEEAGTLGDITDAMAAIYNDEAEKKGIKFITTKELKTKSVYCDHLKVKEIYLNLISNALKYTDSGGTVTVDMRELPSLKKGHTLIQGTISDTGSGMSKEFLPTIFDRFSREKTSTETKIQGTGLGLSIVKKLVDLMGGTITVDSEIGRGTTFVVTLEHRIANTATQKVGEEEVFQTSDFNGKRILVAEDNDLNAEIIISILNDMGIIVERAKDGVECVEMIINAELGYYNLILMDIQMPNMNGYTATDKIRRIKEEKKAFIPIYAMTANAFEEDKLEAKKAGMNGHLTKPIDMKALIEVLNNEL